MIGSATATRIAAAAAVLTGAALIAAPIVLPADVVAPGTAPAVGLSTGDGRYVSAWLPYWKVDSALASFTANADLFTDVTTFFHDVSGDAATLTDRSAPGQVERVIAEARSRSVAVLAAVADDSGRGTMQGILLDPAARTAHIAQLLPLVDELGYDGIDIDYENFAFTDGVGSWAATRPAWVAFITELGAQLKARGKYLTVAVPPQFNDANDDTSGYWVYDWPAIAPHVDSLRVMAYDYSIGEPGPIAPLPWVERTTEFAAAVMGPGTFRVGVPTYGRDWAVAKQGADCGGVPGTVSRTAREMLAVASANGAQVQVDEAGGEAMFEYVQRLPDCTADRVVHFSEARSVTAKAELALANRAGIALWSLGGEDPATWDSLRQSWRQASRVP